jgi:integrase
LHKELDHKFAASVEPIPGRIERYFDTHKDAPRGFLLRITPAGARAWALQYRVKDSSRQREITIGDVKTWPIAQARKRGHQLRREIDAGGDPLADREKKRKEPTVAELIQKFSDEELPSKAPRTQAEYKAMFRDWVLPELKNRKVSDVTQKDVKGLHRKITAAGKMRRANSIKSAISALFNYAIAEKSCQDNPAKGIKGNPERGRRRYLEDEEFDRLTKVLGRWREENKHLDSVDAIELAMLTGARRGEILSMKWEDLHHLDDPSKAKWHKPATLTKDRRPHEVALSGAAAAVLRRRRDERNADGKVVLLRADDYVFRGGGSKTHCNTLERDWYIIRAAAGLEDVRFHDLRHSFASLLISADAGDGVIGAMLGHSKAQTTKRYSHLRDEAQRKAAETVASKIARGRAI